MFNSEELLAPVWDTDTMYAESLTFTEGRSLLMYEPSEIISFYDSHLQKEFKPGVDFIIDGRDVLLTENSDIFSFSDEELYPREEIPGKTFPTEKGNLLFMEGSFFHDRQYAITYKVRKNSWQGHRPSSCSALLPVTFSKLRRGEKLSITLFGDSICVGANASKFVDAEPYCPPYFELVNTALTKRYGSHIDFHNPSVGGKGTTWGVETVEENVNCRKNDLVVISLGANDGDKNREEFGKNIEKIMTAIREKHPQTEFLLIATSLPNKLLSSDKARFYAEQYTFTDELDRFVECGVAKADITRMQYELLNHKRFIDITANNVNHPNDFFHRMYAQYILGMFEV